ncbi:MAG: hypothetical protein DYG94_00015 [Leptolyngbya sp. PLA3]|nr:MAG: hypothetical protein EDM82_01860 [Cyanobacteria bacterium CYA]MCE7967121.1 hypothetical protein [Leptolyngbya sp. PL-A3]
MTGCVLSPTVPAVARRLYRAWMNTDTPIGWTIAHAVPGSGFFGVIMPLALMMKPFGRDPMRRAFDPGAQTYRVRHEQVRDATGDFRRF